MRIRGRFERASQLCYAASGIMVAEPGLFNDRTGLSEITTELVCRRSRLARRFRKVSPVQSPRRSTHAFFNLVKTMSVEEIKAA